MENVIITMFSTAIGAILGGLVTLIVNKKFEITRIRINNINDMKNEVTPALQRYVRVLKSTKDSLLINDFDKNSIKPIIAELENALALLNEKVDTYEIVLSNMLDFFELILAKSFSLLERLLEIDYYLNYFTKFEADLNVLVDMIATFSEEVSEIKRNMLRGNIKNYWRKDIFIKEKADRINYHNKN